MFTNKICDNFVLYFSSCLSPRSAYFYEFPPTDGRETSKKRTTLARLLRGLKTVNRRDRQANQNSGTSTQLRVSTWNCSCKILSFHIWWFIQLHCEHQFFFLSIISIEKICKFFRVCCHFENFYVDLSLSLLTSIIRLKTLNKTFFVSHELLFRQLHNNHYTQTTHFTWKHKRTLIFSSTATAYKKK